MQTKQIIGLFLLLIGLSLIGFAYYARWDTQHANEKAISQFEELLNNIETPKTIPSPKEDNKSTKEEQPEKPTEPTLTEDSIGILSIPKIDLKVIIKEGTDMRTLRRAVGHFTETPYPWEDGNFAIAGHRQYTYGEFFNRVDEIEIGDTATVQTLHGTFEYTISNIQVVDPTQVDVIEDQDINCMTIVTCIKGGTKRIILSATKNQ